jgi:hypothetical protein
VKVLNILAFFFFSVIGTILDLVLRVGVRVHPESFVDRFIDKSTGSEENI